MEVRNCVNEVVVNEANVLHELAHLWLCGRTVVYGWLLDSKTLNSHFAVSLEILAAYFVLLLCNFTAFFILGLPVLCQL